MLDYNFHNDTCEAFHIYGLVHAFTKKQTN